MKTILVTGAAGFIGSHLCERLLCDDHKVIGIDDLSFGRLQNLRSIIAHKNFVFREINIPGYNDFHDLFEQIKFDTVFHLAANSDISNQNPKTEYRNTFNTTFEILEKCRNNNIKELVFTSSGSIYGENVDTIDENHGPLLPISHYAAAKLASEAFISSYSSMYDIKAWICRLPNVVGEHATHGVILDFINKIKRNPDVLEVLGDGNQTKPYMYVKDCINAMLFIWNNAKDQINYFNIGGYGVTSVKKIAEMVIKELGTKTKIVYTGGERGWPGDCPFYRCYNYKLKNLGWSPLISSAEAVEFAIKNIYEDIC